MDTLRGSQRGHVERPNSPRMTSRWSCRGIGDRIAGKASNIMASDNRRYGTHGLSVGSRTMYGVDNVLFKNNTVDGKDLSGSYAPGNFAVRSEPS